MWTCELAYTQEISLEACWEPESGSSTFGLKTSPLQVTWNREVHITRRTKDHLKENTYDIRPGDGHLRDSYLQKEEIETFLIRPRHQPKIDAEDDTDASWNDSVENSHFQHQISTVSTVNTNGMSKRQSSNESVIHMSRRRGALSGLQQYRKMINEVNDIMEKTIDKMALSKRDQWFSSVGIQPLLLTFREPGREKPYLNQPDPLFKYYLLCMLLIFSGITIIHLLIMSSTMEFWIAYVVALILILATCVPSWAGYIWLSLRSDDSDHLLDSSVLKVSRKIWKSTWIRFVIWLAISSIIMFCSIVGLNECIDCTFFVPVQLTNTSSQNRTFLRREEHQHTCEYPWFYTLSAALAMTTTSVFLRMHFMMKLALKGIALAAFWYIIDEWGEEFFQHKTAKLADWEEFGLPEDRSHCYYLAFVFLILHVLDRQIEYVCRLDYLMKVKLNAEQEEVRSMELVNRMLLWNILPPHVSRFYLSKQLNEDTERVETAYHEEKKSVAVLFASIPNYADFYYEDGDNEEGLRCIQLLNEIICGFDLLLCERQFETIEKIKTIGSTYMATCGLQSEEQGSFSEMESPTTNVSTLVQFAVAMMGSLQQLNKDAMQDFQLRVGISVGPVMAGVVGTVKPQYDIWGDTVNVASRMDSTGITGKIQVTKEVENLLSNSDCPFQCECRGEIFVKGKGNLTTYLVQTSYDEPNFLTTQL